MGPFGKDLLLTAFTDPDLVFLEVFVKDSGLFTCRNYTQ